LISTWHRRFCDPESRQKVLLVEDVELNRELAAVELEELCTLIPAANAEQAWELALTQHPDLILLDVCLPGMSGFELCRKLKAEPLTHDIPVIFLTVLGKEQDEEEGLNLGALDYIRKPFSPPILRARVRNHLLMERQRKQLALWSQVDGLTGVANRRTFDLQLMREWKHHLNHKQPLGLLLIDVDEFKAFNDHFGHLAGDEVLRKVALALSRCLHRSNDLVTRYGGEEFAALLPHTNRQGMNHLAETMRAAVRDLDIEHPVSTAASHLSVSIGGASLVPQEDTEGAHELIVLADKQLYLAKAAGRNRVIL
jgi:diguanylate cyclase (GGDEF)-like protein